MDSRYSVHSFDVFDTCLTRVFAWPADLFYAMAAKILRGMTGTVTKEKLHGLVRARVAAERAAREVMTAGDLSLDDIYVHFIAPPGVPVDGAMMKAMELEMEAASVRPIPGMAARIRSLRHAGRTIIFISDMYLPGEAIRGMLLQHGLAEACDKVYVSGDIGLIKRDGGLFRHVLKDLDIPPGAMCHTGDNRLSDIEAARSLGIEAVYTDDAELNEHERACSRLRSTPCTRHSLLGGIGRVVRQPRPDDSRADAELRAIAANHIAPLLTVFTAWVLQDAMEHSVERLSFVSRDGQILYRIAERLAEHTPFRANLPEIGYVYGSRQAWFLPSLYEESFDKLDWLLIPGHSRAPLDLLKKLGLSPEDVSGILDRPQDYWTRQMGMAEAEKFVLELSVPELKNLIAARAAASRELVKEYFAQEVGSGKPPTLVDIGWTLKSQRALSRVLYGENRPCEVKGYYLGLSNAALSENDCGVHRALLIERDPYLDPEESLNYLFRNANCVEQVFTIADHGQCLGYSRKNGQIVPVLRDLEDNPGRERAVEIIHSTVLAYASLAAENGLFDAPALDLRQAALNLAKALLGNPSSDQAVILGSMSVGDDQNESRIRRLARPLGLRDWISMQFPTSDGIRGYQHSFDWIEGSIAMTPKWLRPAFNNRSTFKKLRALRMSK